MSKKVRNSHKLKALKIKRVQVQKPDTLQTDTDNKSTANKKRSVSFVKMGWPIVVLILGLVITWKFDAHKFYHIHPNWTLIIEFINSVKWPIVALIGLFLLRPHLSQIVRYFKLKWGDKEFEVGSQDPVPKTQDREVIEGLSKEQPAGTSQPSKSSAEPAVSTGASEAQNLDDAYNNPEVQLVFERTFRGIYGTQLEALFALSAYKPGLRAEDLLPYLNKHQQLAKNSDSVAYDSIVAFMQYLSTNFLVSYDAASGVFQITQGGEWFIRYISEQGMTMIGRPL